MFIISYKKYASDKIVQLLKVGNYLSSTNKNRKDI